MDAGETDPRLPFVSHREGPPADSGYGLTGSTDTSIRAGLLLLTDRTN